MKKAIVLLSGGLDSATCLYWTKRQGYRPHCLIFDYGQRHRRELHNAAAVAKSARAEYQVVRFTLPWGGSSLTDRKIRLLKDRKISKMSSGAIPSTYVPARNTVFLSLALSYADAVHAGAIVIGANAVDFSGYPDCRPKFIRAMQSVAIAGTRMGSGGNKIKILAPLIKLSKKQIVQTGLKLGVPYKLTWSCYSGGRVPCGKCDSCLLRAQGFEQAGVPDPAL